MKTFREFVGTNEHLSENVFDQIKNAATMFKYMTNPTSFPRPTPSGPANLSGVYRGSSKPAPKPTRFQIGTPKPKPAAPKPTARGGGSPISAVVQALTNLQGDTPQTRTPAQTAEREKRIQARWGDAMNRTPSRFGKAGPDVPEPAGPDQGVGTKPRVAAPYTPPRPAAEPKVEPKPKVTIPRTAKPRVDPFAPVGSTRSVTTERPTVSRSGAPVTSAQAIARGSTEGQGPKSAVSTYRDKEDTKGLSVGRYRTLAQHRAAVAAQKNKK